MKEALYYEKREDQKIKCHLCSFGCRVKEGKTARCLGRKNIEGTFFATNYGETTTLSMDPIEKKPLYHFYPTSQILSIAGNGCNLGCDNCQNWSISQEVVQTKNITPEKVVQYAKKENSIGVAYTYTEPFMWYEFVLDTAKEMRASGLKNVMVSNGTINEEPLRELIPFIDAFNIDLKSMNDRFYRKVCKSLLKPVLNTIRVINEAKTPLLEITNLIIPSLNDSDEDLDKLIDFVADLDPAIPIHFSAYHPSFKMRLPRTPIDLLKKAYDKATKKLQYVYIGNADIDKTSNTYCPNCKVLLIERNWYNTKVTGFDKDKCRSCGEKINIRIN